MKQLNRITLIGFVAHPPVMDVTHGGTAVLKLVVAVTDLSLRTNKRAVAPEFYRVAIFGSGAKDAERVIRKGSYVYVEGAGRHLKYTAKDGIERTAFEVHASTLLRFSSAKDAEAYDAEDAEEAQSA